MTRRKVKRGDPLVVNSKLERLLSQELRWDNDPKFWSKVFICYIAGGVFLAVGLISLFQANWQQISWWEIGYLLNMLIGLGLTIAAGLCHYTRKRSPKLLRVLFKELSIYARQHNRNVRSFRDAIRTKQDDFMERRSWQLLGQKLQQQKFRWEEISRQVYPLKNLQILDKTQTDKIQKLIEAVKEIGVNLLPQSASSEVQPNTHRPVTPHAA